jgi:glycyl-tRNA synthetase
VDNVKQQEHGKDELAHYAKSCVDVVYNFPFGWSELEGIANRTDYDLKQHAQYSGKELTFFDQETNEHVIPYVIEPSAGVDRSLLAFLCDAYDEEQERVVLRLHPRLAPLKAAIFPLVKRDSMPEKAREIEHMLQSHFNVFYDESGSVGRRYRRQDEAGTPFCITVDSQTAEDDTVTLRDRDSMEQVRIPIAGLCQALMERLNPSFVCNSEKS